MPESWDRFIRDEDHFNNTIKYILNNPKKANLPADFEAYRFTGCSVEKVEKVEKEKEVKEEERLKLKLQPAQVRMVSGLDCIEDFNDESSNLKAAIVLNEEFLNLKLLTPALIIKYEGAV